MSNLELAKSFTTIIAKIPKAKREELRPHIQRIQDHLGLKEDLFMDGRKKMWAAEGSARIKVETRPEPKTHKVIYRSSGTIECTTAEAVKISRRKSPGALAVTLCKNGGKFDFMDGDDIITITRL